MSNVTGNTATGHSPNNLVGSFFVLENDTDIDATKINIGAAAGTECALAIYNYNEDTGNFEKEYEFASKFNTAITGVQILSITKTTLSKGIKALFTNSNGLFYCNGNIDNGDKSPLGHDAAFQYKTLGGVAYVYTGTMPATIAENTLTYYQGFNKRLVLFKIA
jgi:hypothetical protein